MPSSVAHLLLDTTKKHGDQIAARYKKNQEWHQITWSDLSKKVQDFASALVSLGTKPGDHVALMSETRLEWVVADMGIVRACAVTVPIYTSSLAAEVAYLLNDSGASVLFVDSVQQLRKIDEIRSQTPALKHVFCFDQDFDSFLAHAKRDNDAELSSRLAALKGHDLATIVYTSGTTGKPKGVMLTHNNLLYEASALDQTGIVSSDDVQLIFLPLAHIFAKVLMLAWIKTAHELDFSEGIDQLMANMKDTRPTVMAAVPRVYEKVHSRVVANAVGAGGIKAALAKWAFALGSHEQPKSLFWPIAKALVFKKVGAKLKETFGGRLKFFISGGAPLAPDIAYFFRHSGITIFEGYGLTESSAATCLNLPGRSRIGTVGAPLKGTEIKIADDGEIFIRGGGVFKGYWNKPEETAEVLTADGWLKSGDIGVLDKDGLLRITDRKKDLIVTAQGKNIAPQKIENLIKSRSPLISQVVVFGDKKPYLVALLTVEESARNKHSEIEAVIQEANKELARFEQIKKFAILDHEFEIGKQLTPSLKVKRKLVSERYQDILEGLYK